MKWIARYNDDTELRQFDETGENKYTDVDRSKLKSFALYMDDYKEKQKAIEIHLSEGQRLIYRKRVEIRTGDKKTVCYMVGWQQTVNQKNIQSIAYVFRDTAFKRCRIEMAGAFQEDHEWFYSPELLEIEK